MPSKASKARSASITRRYYSLAILNMLSQRDLWVLTFGVEDSNYQHPRRLSGWTLSSNVYGMIRQDSELNLNFKSVLSHPRSMS